ncbi:MAG: TRAP transporter fused permease subunit [Desulfobacterales bacterium]|jgi:TRAP transporter 4TM/12TM fusion protein|nr:TRAP transporter fused permease subunit [Desulfobacterales bacterium]
MLPPDENSALPGFGCRFLTWIGTAACIGIVSFIACTTLFGKQSAWVQLEVVLTLALVAVFAFNPGLKKSTGRTPPAETLLALLLIAGSLLTGAYMIQNYQAIAAFREGVPTAGDMAVYICGTLIVLEASRRAEGWILLLVVLAAVAYMFTGPFLPGMFSHRGMDLQQVFELSYSQQGIFGVALDAVVNIVYIYVIFGAALRLTGVGDFFDWISAALTKRYRSGSAQCAIIASALFGSINGSAPANVVANGAITINMMSRAGFSRAYAGAVEASSSVVGQIMPPVMGVGAFIMSEITGIPYLNIMLAAIIPSLVFILSLGMVTALEAEKLGIQGERDNVREPWSALRISQFAVMTAGFGVLLMMLFMGYSVDLCGLAATATVVGLSLILPWARTDTARLWRIAIDGGKEGLSVTVSCAAIGIIIGAVAGTGLGIKISQAIVAMGGEYLVLALILAAACSILLGMGLPTAASYLMVIAIAGPAIIKLEVSVLAAHLFVFYFAVMSAISPPVALAVFAAAAIAQVPVMQIALISMRLCLVAFILPFMWIYHPELMLQDLSPGMWPGIAGGASALLAGTVALAAMQVGYFKGRLSLLERTLLGIAAAIIFWPGTITTVVGCAMTSAVLGRRLVSSKRFRKTSGKAGAT